MSDNVKRIKILRRVADGKEFTYDTMLDGLVRKGVLRVIEKHIDASGKLVDEIDLTRLDDDNSEKALREAIAHKWPHLVPLIDRPEVARLAAETITGKTKPARPIEVDGVGEVGDGIPPADEDDDTPPAEAPKPKAKAKAEKAPKEAVEKPADVPPTEAEVKVAAFADEIMKQPGRDGVQAFAAKHGITIGSAAKGTMVAEAVAIFTEQVNAAPKA